MSFKLKPSNVEPEPSLQRARSWGAPEPPYGPSRKKSESSRHGSLRELPNHHGMSLEVPQLNLKQQKYFTRQESQDDNLKVKSGKNRQLPKELIKFLDKVSQRCTIALLMKSNK